MFLKAVRARGFKSFARPVEFAFDRGITVVVGPNGSGKSNIADAVVWAMGEQSPRAVRGASMQDVIFSGSDKLPPAGMAEVELLFDNSDGSIPIDFSEVLVSRRLYRDGEGKYFINRSACRLIDVGELLSDAGLGRDGHSIVSQGKVDAVLESRPEQRRAHIEEAAGLGKYKKRRHRAERKLAAVRRNLERLADVEEEVKAHLRPLKRQATAAERSARLEKKIAATRARLIKGRMEQLAGELARAEAASRDAGERRRELERKLAAAAAERRATEERLTASLKVHKQLVSRYYELGSLRRGLEQKRDDLARQRRTLARAAERAGERIGNLQGQMQRAREELERARRDRRDGRVRLEQVEAEIRLKQQELERVTEALARRRREDEERSRLLREAEAACERFRHQLEYLRRRRQKLAEDVEACQERIDGYQSELRELGEKLSSREAAQEEAERRLAAARQAAADAGRRYEEMESEREAVAKELRQVEEELKIARARLTFIGDSDRDRAGLPPAAKELSRDEDLKALVDLVEVEPGYERAVAAVLGRALFALAVKDLDEAKSLLERVREAGMGGVEFIVPGRGDAPASRGESLLDHVRVPGHWAPFVSDLLASVAVVDDLDGIDGEGVWVTRDGVVYHGERRLLSYHADPPASVVLRQRHERRRLERERQAAEERRDRLAARVEDLEQRFRQAREQHRQAERSLAEAAEAARAAGEGMEALERRCRVLEQELELETERRDHFRGEAEKVGGEFGEVEKRLEEAERSLADIQPRQEEDGDGDLEAQRDQLEQELTELRITAARVREREQLAAGTVERMEPQLERLAGESAAAARQVEAGRRLDPRLQELSAALERLTGAFEEVAGAVAGRMKEAEAESEEISASLKELSQAEADLQQQLSRASDDTTDCEVGLAKLRDQVREQQEQLDELQERFPEEIEAAEATPPGELEETEALLERLERRRENIGPVNPLAAQEYQEMLERQEFLAEQRRDLEQSMSELRGLIRELTRHIESTFAETFEAVRKNFAEVVAALFPGGEGRLRIVEPEDGDDEEDPVADEPAGEEGEETVPDFDRRGVEISVKPARKAVRSLSLLSGGERSLVAIAFLFAIFLARPAPFYILDEVEAALDDANIDRLLNMLRRFQDRTQFIVITHQKRTMEVADVLYGVSMGADGTSKVLSRRMQKPDGPPEGDGSEEEAGGKEGEEAAAPAALAG